MKGGLFPGLTGVIYTKQYKKRCLFYLTTKWEGKKTFNDSLLELMSETLTKLGLKLIFRKTKN
ncbi:hypothetical protein N9N67_09680 [Bacteriovoracaceae bacterium]|nr:hypothetical protein [Bacteriovoracaceae bacterium]